MGLIEPWQRRNLARFCRNLALQSGQLVVDLFDLLVAARGCVSDNFAWEAHRLATAYPLQAERATDLPTARIRADEMFLGVRRIQAPTSRSSARGCSPSARGMLTLIASQNAFASRSL